VINPFIFLQFDSVGSFIGLDISAIQILPVISIVALLFLIFMWFSNEKLFISKVEIILLFTVPAYLLTVTFFEIIQNDWTSYYISGFLRQSLSLLVFMGMYLMFRLISNDPKYIFKGIYLGLIILIPISIFQIFNFSLGSERLTGFSSEPSHFGHFLVFALLPSIMILKNEIKFYRSIFLFVNMLVFLTLSLTAIVQLIILYIVIYLNIGVRGLIVILLSIFGLLLIPAYLPDSYLVSNLQLFSSFEAFEKGISTSASLADRFYSSYSPLASLGSEIKIWGNGIASDYYYFDEIVPYPANELIAESRGDYIGLSSFFGKIVSWGGIPLLIFFILTFYNLYKEADKNLRKFSIPVFFASLYSLGSLASPYICLWLVILRISSKKTR